MNRQGEALTLFLKKSAFFCKVYMYRSDHLKDAFQEIPSRHLNISRKNNDN